jgi:hypothetical protein
MSEQVTLRYHDWTFRLLGREPRVSANAVRAIATWEVEQRIKLPGSVREWYSLDGMEDFLAMVCPEYRVVPLPQFLTSFARAARHTQNGPPQIMVFSPGVYLVLEGLDDPIITPVVRPLSKALADFAWERVLAGQPNLVVGTVFDRRMAEFGPPHLDFLLEALPQARCSWGHPSHIRFFRPGGWVQAWPQGDPLGAPCPAWYELWAETEEQLLRLYALLWPCHGAPVALWPRGLRYRCDAATSADFEARFRARFPGVEVLPER